MSFVNHTWLYLAPLIGCLMAGCILLGLRRKDSLLNRFASPRLVEKLTSKGSLPRVWIKAGFIILSAMLVALAMARPQWGSEFTERKAKGLDIIFVLDTSRSMLATDLRPTRLDRAKLAIRDIITRLESDRIGLVAFAGNAFLQTPPTLDYAAFRESLEAVSPKIMTSGGSDLGRALREAANAFSKENSYKVCILLTDGEDLGGDALQAAKEAAEQNIKVHTIGIGTPEGDYLRILGESGQEEFIRDTEGHPVRSQLDEATLQQISQTTGGNYYRLSNQSLSALYQSVLATLPRQELESEMQEIQIERFQWFIGAALALLILETLVRRRKWSPNIHTVIGLSLMSLWALPHPVQAQTDDEAPSSIDEPSVQPDDPRKRYNQAHQLLLDGNYTEAAQEFANAIQNTSDIQLQADALYNQALAMNELGNAALEAQDYEAAVEHWQNAESLFSSAREINPTDIQAEKDAHSVGKRREALEQFLKEQEAKQNPQQDQSSDNQESPEESAQDDSQQQSSDSSQSGDSEESKQDQQQSGESDSQQENGESSQSSEGEQQSEANENTSESGKESNETGESGDESNSAEPQNNNEQSNESESASSGSEEDMESSEQEERTGTESAESEEDEDASRQSTADPREDIPEPESEGESASTGVNEADEADLGQNERVGEATSGSNGILSEEEISHQEAKALLDSLRHSERLLPFSQRSNGAGKRDVRDW